MFSQCSSRQRAFGPFTKLSSMSVRLSTRRLLIPLSLVVSTVAWLAAYSTSSPPLPASQRRADVALKADSVTLQGVVPTNSTLDGLLKAYGIGTEATQRLIAAARPLFDPRRLRAAHPFAMVRSAAGALRSFE